MRSCCHLIGALMLVKYINPNKYQLMQYPNSFLLKPLITKSYFYFLLMFSFLIEAKKTFYWTWKCTDYRDNLLWNISFHDCSLYSEKCKTTQGVNPNTKTSLFPKSFSSVYCNNIALGNAVVTNQLINFDNIISSFLLLSARNHYTSYDVAGGYDSICSQKCWLPSYQTSF